MDKKIITEDEVELFIRGLSNENEVIKNYGKTVENKIFINPFYHSGEITLSFKNCIFENKFSFVDYLPSANIYFDDCEFSKDIFFWKLETVGKISFLNCSIKSKFIFNDCKIDILELNNKHCDHLLFDGDSAFQILEIGGKEANVIEKISLPASIIQKRCTIDHANIISLRVAYSTLEKELNIFNCNINSLTIDNFRNNGFLRFLNCKSLNLTSFPSEFIISRSNLGKAEFYNFDFASFSKVNIVNGILLDSLYISSKWAKNIVSIDPYSQPTSSTISILPNKVYASVIREVYKQIKFAMSKQGNVVEEQYFHGLEMNAYDNSLSFRSNLWTKVILKLSFYTSNYGQSLLRPILTLLFINGLLTAFLNREIGLSLISLDKITYEDILNEIANFLWFTNPLHRNDPELKGLPLIIDILIRIVSAYCIYNIIRASRRFIK